MKLPSKRQLQLAGYGAIALLAYWGLGSFFWGEPKVSIVLPPTASRQADLPVKVCVRALHANFEITSVRFDWDNWGRFGKGDNKAVPMQMLHEAPGREYWTNWTLRRWTYPHSKCLDLHVPLAKIKADGMLPDQKLTGRVIVEVQYPHVIRRRRMGWPYHYAEMLRTTTNYSIELSP